MSCDIVMPKLGFSMNEGQIEAWLVGEGEQVVAGQPLFTLESDKSTTEIESPGAGVLRILAQPGETYEVGTLLGRLD